MRWQYNLHPQGDNLLTYLRKCSVLNRKSLIQVTSIFALKAYVGNHIRFKHIQIKIFIKEGYNDLLMCTLHALTWDKVTKQHLQWI